MSPDGKTLSLKVKTRDRLFQHNEPMATTTMQPRQVYKPYKPARVWPFLFSCCQLAFLAWLIWGATRHAHVAPDCTGLCKDAYTAGYNTGRWLACGVIIALWVAFDIIVGVTTYILRRD
jgi:hypothetical protein